MALRYGHLDLWLFTPDADKAGELAALEKEAEGKGVRLLCCAAKPEVEAWLNWGLPSTFTGDSGGLWRVGIAAEDEPVFGP